MKFAFETDLARKGLIDYNTAIQRAYLTKMRFELAKPYSVIVLGHSHGWFYDEGILAYPLGDVIRILDVYNAAVEEDVIDVRSLFGEKAGCWPQHTQGIQEILSKKHYISTLAYRKGILLFRIGDVDSPSAYLVAISIRKYVPLQKRLLMIRTCSSRCKAQTDGRYIIVFKDPKSNGNLELYDLEDERQGIQKRHLPEFTVYNNADRQIYDGCFYLLSNRRSDHDDNTVQKELSGYNYCYRFPLNGSRPVASYDAASTEPLPEQQQVVRVKRQQPRTRPNNGPVPHHPWSSLKLWRDDYSGQLVIVEGWHHDGEEDDGENAQYTFQPLPFPEPSSAIDTAMSEAELFYFGNAVQTLNPADLPRAEKDCECPRDPGNRLRARVYVPRVSTFFDIYPGSDDTPDSKKGFEFHLAVGSCSSASLSGSVSDEFDKIPSRKTDGISDDDKRHFVGVRRFPPNDAPKALLDLLWPTTGKMRSNIFSTHDPRSIAYSTKPSDRKWNDTAREIVLINFDPYTRFPGLKSMVLRPLSTQLTPRDYEDELLRAKEAQGSISWEEWEEKRKKRAAKQERLREMHKDDEVEEVPEPISPWLRTEQAMYLSIGQGFQFS